MLRADASSACRALGDDAASLVPLGSLTIYGSRLGWPAWLFTGSSMAAHVGPPPPRITAADDLLIGANLFAHMGACELAEHALRAPQPAAGPVARLALASTPNLKEAFSYIQRVTSLGSPFYRSQFETIGATASVGLTGSVPLGRLMDYLGLLFVALHHRIVRDLIFDESDRIGIGLTLPEADGGAQISRLFGTGVKFGAAANRLSIPDDWLSLPNPAYDPALWALAQERLMAAEAQASDACSIAQLRLLIATMLAEARRIPRLQQIAQAQGISTRTLVRRIAEGGHSFRGLVDQELRLRAAYLINDPGLSIRAIADELGFPDVSSFGRKFRQWFGDSPGHFRRASR